MGGSAHRGSMVKVLCVSKDDHLAPAGSSAFGVLSCDSVHVNSDDRVDQHSIARTAVRYTAALRP